jgi:hypothetical protein
MADHVSAQSHVSSREGLRILEKSDINIISLEATPNSYFLCCLKSATTTWRSHEFVKREQHRRHYRDAITIVIGDETTPPVSRWHFLEAAGWPA